MWFSLQHAHWDGRLEEITLRHIGNQDGLTVIAKNIRFCFVDLLLVVYFCSTLPFINLKLFSGCRNFSVTCISGEESFHQVWEHTKDSSPLEFTIMPIWCLLRNLSHFSMIIINFILLVVSYYNKVLFGLRNSVSLSIETQHILFETESINVGTICYHYISCQILCIVLVFNYTCNIIYEFENQFQMRYCLKLTM